MFRNKRKDSAIRTLVAETLVLAKTHGYVEKIEHELEEELQRENKGPPNRILAKWRHKGEKLLKNKYTLLTVAIFCVTECALILGELILDLHKVKDVLEAQEELTSTFAHNLHKIYPVHVPSPDVETSKLFDRILISDIQWKDPYSIANNQSIHSSHSPNSNINSLNNETRHKRSMSDGGTNSNNVNSNNYNSNNNYDNNFNDNRYFNSDDIGDVNSDNNPNVNSKTLFITSAVYNSIVNNLTALSLRSNNVTSSNGGDDVSLGSSTSPGVSGDHGHGPTSSFSAGHSLEEEIAHALHMASITILSILVFQTILKALCAGSAFFHRKLETFDLCVVLISFVVDLVCMQIMPRYKIQDFVFILAFLLPWRVIRVVNSLVVAVQDHEHFRLKLIYGRKKKILNTLRESEVKLQLFRAQCNALKRLCYNEGIEEAKVDQILMVEECVVTKAGKSKCKVKIDNSSVIVLNDKSDFPRLSPRPSILNLFDYGSRRKSMQPQSLSSNDRELFLKTGSKDSSSKKGLGFLRTRTRSNSESGRGTLSSPDESGTRGQSSFGESAISGLNTPVLIDRKSSLNSPIIANHVKNILSSLEGGGMGGENGASSAAYRYGRGSLDEGNKHGSRESEGKVSVGRGVWKSVSKPGSSDSSGGTGDGSGGGGAVRRSSSNDIASGIGGNTCNGNGYNGGVRNGGCAVGPAALPNLKSRRGSLQPQKRVDEDEDLTHYIQVPPPPPPPAHPHTLANAACTISGPGGQTMNTTTTASVHQGNGNSLNQQGQHSLTNANIQDTSQYPTTINYNPFTTASTMPHQAIQSSQSPICKAIVDNEKATTTSTSSSPPQEMICVASIEKDAQEDSSCDTSNKQQQQQQPILSYPKPTPRLSLDYSIHESPHEDDAPEDLNLIELNHSTKDKPSMPSQPAGLKPKTFRTPSDIENENNLTTANDLISSPSSSSFTSPDPQIDPVHLEANGTAKYSGHGTPRRHSSITEESEPAEPEKEDEIMV